MDIKIMIEHLKLVRNQAFPGTVVPIPVGGSVVGIICSKIVKSR